MGCGDVIGPGCLSPQLSDSPSLGCRARAGCCLDHTAAATLAVRPRKMPLGGRQSHPSLTGFPVASTQTSTLACHGARSMDLGHEGPSLELGMQ